MGRLMILQGFSRDTIRTIAKNAGKMPKDKIARDLCISIGFLERIAREHGIDLRMVEDRNDHPAPFSAYEAERGKRSRALPSRTDRVELSLFPAVMREIDRLANTFGLRRATAVARVVENAAHRGLLEDLIRLPAPTPDREEG